MVTDSIRNIKSMWEKGGAFSSAGSGGAQFKVKVPGGAVERGSAAGSAARLADSGANLPTGSSCDEDGRGRPHQRLAE